MKRKGIILSAVCMAILLIGVLTVHAQSSNKKPMVDSELGYTERSVFDEKEDGWVYGFEIIYVEEEQTVNYIFDGYNLKHKPTGTEYYISYKDMETGEEIERFDSITIPHYILGLDNFKAFNANKKNGKSFIDFLRAFWQSDCYKRFVDACNAKDGGSSFYSSECVEERQSIIYDFVDEYLDTAENDNGDDEDEYNTEKGSITHEEERAESSNCTDNETESSLNEKTNDVRAVPSVGGSCGQTSDIGYEEQKDTNCLSGREPIITSA